MSPLEPVAIRPSDEKSVYERCWCWQMGRCLVDCPTADLPKPVPMTDENWKRAWMEVTGRRLYAIDDDPREAVHPADEHYSRASKNGSPGDPGG